MIKQGHKILNAEKINDFLKIIAPTLNSFERNFCAYKLAENENLLLNSQEAYKGE